MTTSRTGKRAVPCPGSSPARLSRKAARPDASWSAVTLAVYMHKKALGKPWLLQEHTLNRQKSSPARLVAEGCQACRQLVSGELGQQRAWQQRLRAQNPNPLTH